MLYTCPYFETTVPVADGVAGVVLLERVEELLGVTELGVADADVVLMVDEAGVPPEPAVQVATGPPGAV